MIARPIYLADTSVYVLQRKHQQVRHRFEKLLTEGRLTGCQMVSLEFLNNAPDPKTYETLWARCTGTGGSTSTPRR